MSKKAKKTHLKHGDTLGACPSPPPSPVLTYQCPGPNATSILSSSSGTTRFAQTFTAAESGSLQQIQFEVDKASGSTSAYLVELQAAANDVPTNTVLAAITISNASVPDGALMLMACISGPPLTAGTEYAAAISRPGGNQLQLWARTGNNCPGRLFIQTPRGSGSFNEIEDFELIASVTVLV